MRFESRKKTTEMSGLLFSSGGVQSLLKGWDSNQKRPSLWTAFF